VALCRRTRQIVAFVIGDRSAKTCARLWGRIPESYRQGRSFSDFWTSYRPVFEDDSSHYQVGKSSGELAYVERFFGRLRQKLARFVRRTRVTSESGRMLHLTTKLFVEGYNEAVTQYLPATAFSTQPLLLALLHNYWGSTGKAWRCDMRMR